MVKNILGMVAGGYSSERIIQAYPELTAEDVSAALEYAAELVTEEQIFANVRSAAEPAGRSEYTPRGSKLDPSTMPDLEGIPR